MPDQFQFQDQEGDDQPKRNRWIDKIPWIVAIVMLLLAGAFALKAFSGGDKQAKVEPSIVGQPLPEPEVKREIQVVPSQAEQALMEEVEKLKKLLGEKEQDAPHPVEFGERTPEQFAGARGSGYKKADRPLVVFSVEKARDARLGIIYLPNKAEGRAIVTRPEENFTPHVVVEEGMIPEGYRLVPGGKLKSGNTFWVFAKP